MKTYLALILVGAFFLMNTPSNAEEEKGIIGRVYVDGFPVIYKYVNEMPPAEVRKQLQWLTVISWKYDGASNNGMPHNDVDQRMIELEDTIEENIENDKVLRHVYSRTGNNIKDLVYYIHDKKQFLEAFNKALVCQSRYPLEISFYQDSKWEDFQRVLNDFAGAAKNE